MLSGFAFSYPEFFDRAEVEDAFSAEFIPFQLHVITSLLGLGYLIFCDLFGNHGIEQLVPMQVVPMFIGSLISGILGASYHLESSGLGSSREASAGMRWRESPSFSPISATSESHFTCFYLLGV